jgi:hypothetical protein
MMKKILSLLLLTLSSFQAFAELELKSAPDGYKWVKILKDQSAVLQPEGWFYREEHSKRTDAYFITKENIAEAGSFSTGLALNVIYNIDKKSNVSPSKFAAAMILEFQKNSANKVLLVDAKQNGPFVNLVCRFKAKAKKSGEKDIVAHYLYVANDKTGTLWIFSFEAPEKEWDVAWETGSIMLNNLLIESEI